jgi:hypothetical protein
MGEANEKRFYVEARRIRAPGDLGHASGRR